MNFIGLDLAWGSLDPDKKPNRTGIAVLDAGGGLTYVGVQVFDVDIRAVVSPYVEGPCVVAIDAPLKVTNQKGRRLAEEKLGDHFAQFDAGAHSANIERFSADPRGARVARSFGLDIDPRSTGPRRAIEVYPHPATVALFKLGRIFKIKKGSPEERRPQMLKYMEAIDSLATSPVPMFAATNDDWNRLRQDVKAAQRPFELDRAEDQVDAVMCAYIALYAERRPGDVTIYGDFPDNGYILTPTLPPGLKPTPRQPAIPNVITKPLSPHIAAESQRCSGLAAAIQAAWTDIDEKVHKLDSIPTGDAMEFIVDLLRRVDYAREFAEQELSTIRDQLARLSPDDTAAPG